MKHGKLISSKYKNPQKGEGAYEQNGLIKESNILKGIWDIISEKLLKEVLLLEIYRSKEISIYVSNAKDATKSKIVVDNLFQII